MDLRRGGDGRLRGNGRSESGRLTVSSGSDPVVGPVLSLGRFRSGWVAFDGRADRRLPSLAVGLAVTADIAQVTTQGDRVNFNAVLLQQSG